MSVNFSFTKLFDDQSEFADKIFSDDEYHFICPLCREEKGDRYFKRKLYVKSDQSVGYCHRCNTTFLNSDLTERPIVEKQTYSINGSELTKKFIDQIIAPIKSDKDANEYINSRSGLYKGLTLKGFHDLGDKVLIDFISPFDRKPYFYQLRYKNPAEGQAKYYTPVCDYKPLYIPLGSWDPNHDTVITEGVFSALALKVVFNELNVVATLGSSLTKYQTVKLLYFLKSPRYFIMFDTSMLSWKLKRKLSSKLPSNYSKKFYVIPSIECESKKGIDQEELYDYFNKDVSKYREYILSAINKWRR